MQDKRVNGLIETCIDALVTQAPGTYPQVGDDGVIELWINGATVLMEAFIADLPLRERPGRLEDSILGEPQPRFWAAVTHVSGSRIKYALDIAVAINREANLPRERFQEIAMELGAYDLPNEMWDSAIVRVASKHSLCCSDPFVRAKWRSIGKSTRRHALIRADVKATWDFVVPQDQTKEQILLLPPDQALADAIQALPELKSG